MIQKSEPCPELDPEFGECRKTARNGGSDAFEGQGVIFTLINVTGAVIFTFQRIE